MPDMEPGLGASLLGLSQPEAPVEAHEDEGGEEIPEPLLIAGEDMMAALQTGDTKGFLAALEDYLEMRGR